MNAAVIVHDRLERKFSLADSEQRNTVYVHLYVYNDDGGGIIDSCSDGLLGYNKLCCCYEQTC